ncbi:hypothetical protein JSY14_03720 [Brachybacterium sp. EF45031]|uniref:hypothetical protein n=1 Tax=Brachybacterium sillae TaxID=2810536 RepID=UPI00217E4FC1|nr:hypothetical protein [Brachybacterium sillae]MCS6711165.1 hypothetical protein [Brachybacterium sillae]
MSTPSLVTERDLAGALEILARASDTPPVLATLTDEELLGLAGRDGVGLVGSPYLDSSDLPPEAMATIAVRSLVARGLAVIGPTQREPEGRTLGEALDDVPGGGGDGSGTAGRDGAPDTSERAVQLDRTLAGLLTLRETPVALMNLTWKVSEQTTSLTVYVFPEGGLLEELVTADGFHHFSVPTRAAAPARWARYVDQSGAAGDEDRAAYVGPLERLDDPGSGISDRLADTRALTVLSTAGDAGGDSLQVTLMATSDAVFAMDTPESTEGDTEIRELSAQSLIRLIDAAIPEVSAT